MPTKNSLSAKLSQLVQVEGVAAVPPKAEAVRKKADRGINESASIDTVANKLPGADAELFMQQGWRFVDLLAAGQDALRVFRDVDGHAKIESGRLHVRFKEKVTSSEFNALLKEHGLTICRELGFAPNLYEVRFDAENNLANSIETARSLLSSPMVDYAEPILIEAWSSR